MQDNRKFDRMTLQNVGMNGIAAIASTFANESAAANNAGCDLRMLAIARTHHQLALMAFRRACLDPNGEQL